MRERIKTFLQNRMWGSFKKPLPIRKQLSRMITLCCVTAVCIQAIVMVAMAMNQYVTKEREDALYILENDNVKIDNMFQYVGEIAISIQHNVGLRSFFNGGIYNEELMVQQLESVSNLFSERNRLEVFEPFVERIYLYNESGKSISNLYYPVTISERNQAQLKSDELYKAYKKAKQEFYFQVEGKYLNLCMKLYDDVRVKTINKFVLIPIVP